MIAVDHLEEKLKQIQHVIMDVDGVLTTGRLLIGRDGFEAKSFHICDGVGIYLLRMAHIDVSLLSGRYSPATSQRADELKITDVHQDVLYKGAAFEKIARARGVTGEQCVYVGDDLIDIPALKRAGVAIAVQNACEDAKHASHYVTQACGGEGAVREVAEMILKAKGLWSDILEKYLTPK